MICGLLYVSLLFGYHIREVILRPEGTTLKADIMCGCELQFWECQFSEIGADQSFLCVHLKTSHYETQFMDVI